MGITEKLNVIYDLDLYEFYGINNFHIFYYFLFSMIFWIYMKIIKFLNIFFDNKKKKKKKNKKFYFFLINIKYIRKTFFIFI